MIGAAIAAWVAGDRPRERRRLRDRVRGRRLDRDRRRVRRPGDPRASDADSRRRVADRRPRHDASGSGDPPGRRSAGAGRLRPGRSCGRCRRPRAGRAESTPVRGLSGRRGSSGRRTAARRTSRASAARRPAAAPCSANGRDVPTQRRRRPEAPPAQPPAPAAATLEARARAADPRSTRPRPPSVARRRPGPSGATPSGQRDGTSGAMPSCQIRRPSGVSHSTVPTRSADPSDSSNSPRTVPVPNVVSPTISARSASWSAPDTISAELAVLPSTSDDERQVGRHAVRRDRRGSVSSPCGVALDVDDPARQELAGDADGLVDVAAGVAAQVEDDPRRRRPSRAAFERLDDVVGGAVRELVEPDEGGRRARDHRPRDRVDRHVGADDVERRAPGRSPPARTVTLDRRAGLAADPARRPRRWSCRSVGAVDRDDDVAGREAGRLGRAALEDADDLRQARRRSARSGRRCRRTSRTATSLRSSRSSGVMKSVWPVSPTASVRPSMAP